MRRFYPLVLGILLIIILIQGVLLILIFTGRMALPAHPGLPGASPTSAASQWGKRTKTSGCTVRGALPDPACTPGDILPGITKERVCQPGYASSIRDVTTHVKNQVYAAYGITQRRAKQYEIDHLINLSIGGSNDLSNLWPQAARPLPGFPQKDRSESYLHDQVCAGKMSLPEAQMEIATNWLTVFNRMPQRAKTPIPNDPGTP